MNIQDACVECIITQSARVADAINADEKLKQELISTVKEMSKSFSFEKTPPQIAADVYEKMAKIAHKDDLYDEVKAHSTQKALSFVPLLKEKLLKSENKLLTATKIAVAGNVIDLAAEVTFDLEEELLKIFEIDFAHDDFKALQDSLSNAVSILIIGDNVGEHIFDYIFIETLKELYPNAVISYMVRGVPIINDVTLKEAKEAGFDSLCKLVNSGVNTPGFDYERASEQAKEVYDTVDVVISKGMGNFESLSPTHRQNVYFLLKIKCNVVANFLAKEVGDIICKKV